MTTVLNEGRHPAEFLVSEANNTRSRDTATVASGQVLDVGQVVQANLSGQLVAFDGETVTDGSLVTEAAGVMWAAVDATDGAVAGAVYIARDAEVNASEIFVADDDTDGTVMASAIASLRRIGVVARAVPAREIE